MNELLFDVPTRQVSWQSGGKHYGFEVRGLSDEDLVKLVRDNDESLNKAFDVVQGISGENPEDLTNTNAVEFGKALLEAVPELVAQMIALAADMPDKAPVVRKMPAPIKLQALTAVWELTVIDTGGLESFLEQVLGLMKGLRTNMDQMKHRLTA